MAPWRILPGHVVDDFIIGAVIRLIAAGKQPVDNQSHPSLMMAVRIDFTTIYREFSSPQELNVNPSITLHRFRNSDTSIKDTFVHRRYIGIVP